MFLGNVKEDAVAKMPRYEMKGPIDSAGDQKAPDAFQFTTLISIALLLEQGEEAFVSAGLQSLEETMRKHVALFFAERGEA